MGNAGCLTLSAVLVLLIFCCCTFFNVVAASDTSDVHHSDNLTSDYIGDEAQKNSTPDHPIKSITDFSAIVTDEYKSQWYYDEDDESYYLFLPSCADLNSLEIKIESSDIVYLNDNIINSGDVLALKDNSEHTISCNGVSATIRIMKSANIPAMFINTETGSMDYVNINKDNKEEGKILFIDSDGEVQHNGDLEFIKGRGNSSWDYSLKKPYNIKIADKVDLCGMGKSRKWALISNYLDQSMIRNSITYDIGKALGLNYSIEYQYIDFFANGEYYGTYALTERVEVDKGRVEITDLEKSTEKANNVDDLSIYKRGGSFGKVIPSTTKYFEIPNDPDDITGGYLLEHQLEGRYHSDPSGFVSDLGQTVILKSPEYASKAQVEYISSFYQEMEDAVYSDTGFNSLGKHYSEYIDLDSLATVYLMQELSSNPDCSGTSFFIYKESDLKGDGKFHFGPLWDFDLAYCNFSIYVHQPDMFYSNKYKHSNTEILGIMGQLYKDKYFFDIVIDKYFNDLLPAIMTVCGSELKAYNLDSMRNMASEYARSYEMNYIVWDIEKKPLGPFTGSNLLQNINFLEEYITSRMVFLFGSWISPYFEIDGESENDSNLPLTAINNYLLNSNLHSDKSLKVKDINSDGEINVVDKIILKRALYASS